MLLFLPLLPAQTDDVHAIINGKLAEKYKGSQIDAMKAIATAHDKRSLLDFEQALIKYKKGNCVDFV